MKAFGSILKINFTKAIKKPFLIIFHKKEIWSFLRIIIFLLQNMGIFRKQNQIGIVMEYMNLGSLAAFFHEQKVSTNIVRELQPKDLIRIAVQVNFVNLG